MDHIHHVKHKLESIVEGDINLTPARGEWLQEEVNNQTKLLLEKDARFFFAPIHVNAVFGRT